MNTIKLLYNFAACDARILETSMIVKSFKLQATAWRKVVVGNGLPKNVWMWHGDTWRLSNVSACSALSWLIPQIQLQVPVRRPMHLLYPSPLHRMQCSRTWSRLFRDSWEEEIEIIQLTQLWPNKWSTWFKQAKYRNAMYSKWRVYDFSFNASWFSSYEIQQLKEFAEAQHTKTQSNPAASAAATAVVNSLKVHGIVLFLVIFYVFWPLYTITFRVWLRLLLVQLPPQRLCPLLPPRLPLNSHLKRTVQTLRMTCPILHPP